MRRRQSISWPAKNTYQILLGLFLAMPWWKSKITPIVSKMGWGRAADHVRGMPSCSQYALWWHLGSVPALSSGKSPTHPDAWWMQPHSQSVGLPKELPNHEVPTFMTDWCMLVDIAVLHPLQMVSTQIWTNLIDRLKKILYRTRSRENPVIHGSFLEQGESILEGQKNRFCSEL